MDLDHNKWKIQYLKICDKAKTVLIFTYYNLLGLVMEIQKILTSRKLGTLFLVLKRNRKCIWKKRRKKERKGKWKKEKKEKWNKGRKKEKYSSYRKMLSVWDRGIRHCFRGTVLYLLDHGGSEKTNCLRKLWIARYHLISLSSHTIKYSK